MTELAQKNSFSEAQEKALQLFSLRIEAAERLCQHKFHHQILLLEALTHKSAKGLVGFSGDFSNERLEFLGDALLNAHAAKRLWERFPEWSEGRLSKNRARLVCGRRLSEVALSLGLEKLLILGKGVSTPNLELGAPLLEDCLEAIIAAIYVDAGKEAMEVWVDSQFDWESVEGEGVGDDFKTRLQEKVQAVDKVTPHYKTVASTGPDHQKEFTVAVYSQETLLAYGRGLSKRKAEQEAAKAALSHSQGRN